MKLSQQFLDLLLPANCLLCEKPPSVLCENCLLRFENRSRSVHRGQLVGFALCEFDDEISLMLSAFKERGQFAIARLLVDELLGERQLEQLRALGAQALVSISSSKASFAKRGYSPAQIVASSLGRRLGLPTMGKALQLNRVTEDQASLTVDARATNLVGAMTCSTSVAGRRVILVDDIVTTGASVIEAARAVEASGGRVVGFFAIAETLLRNSAPNEASGTPGIQGQPSQRSGWASPLG
jgi:ComF family protein